MVLVLQTIKVPAQSSAEVKPAPKPFVANPFLENPYLSADASPIRPIPHNLTVNQDKAKLGKKLFNEPRLSHNQKISCTSCHDLSQGGADGKSLPSVSGQSGAKVNTLSVFNAPLHPYFFWDGSVKSMKTQVALDLTKHMGADWGTLVPLIKADPAYSNAFSRLYPDGVSKAAICDAIAEFQRTLLTPNSRFDRYLRGEEQIIDIREKKGYQLFVKYGCVNCHQGVGVGGNMFERLGVIYPPLPDKLLKKYSVYPSADEGRLKVTGKEEHRYYFRVPSLRNVEKTAPYFHDGSIATLEDAIRIMAYYNLGASLPERDIQLIAGFLRTLTGEYSPQP